MARDNIFICGHDEDGNPWSEVRSYVTGNDLYTRDGKVIRLHHDFDEYEVVKWTNEEIREICDEYNRAMLALIAEVFNRKGKS